MKDYISTLQSQIARNSIEIRELEALIEYTHYDLHVALKDYVDELKGYESGENSARYLDDMNLRCELFIKELLRHKKTLKKLAENQKMLKKLKTQLVLLDNIYGEEDW